MKILNVLVAFLRRTLMPPIPEIAMSKLEHHYSEDAEVERIMAFHEMD